MKKKTTLNECKNECNVNNPKNVFKKNLLEKQNKQNKIPVY